MNEIPVFKFALRDDLKDEKQFLPRRAEDKATGWDVRAAMPNREPLILKPLKYVKISLGFRAYCAEGWWYELKPRSSTFAKKQLHSLYGTIDEGYENEAVFACQYIPEMHWQHNRFDGKLEWNSGEDLIINFGDAIGQIIPVRRKEMDVVEIDNYEYDILCKKRNGQRGTGGFGSTDLKKG